MAESLRILILEDNPTDAELVQFELQEAGLVFTAEVVMTENDFIHELQAFSPDLILSDYDLPKYNGTKALAEAKKRCPDIPFILVTGAVSEDRAIEILTQGAKDYVLKTRLAQRLVPAVKRALAETKEHKERKEAQEELKAASLYSRSLIEASLDPLVTISPDGKVMDVNKATEEITGCSREQIIGNDFSDYFTDPDQARAGYQKVFLEGSVKDYPLSIRHISGNITQVLYNATVYRNENGEVQGVFAAARDVTELKKAETELREAHGTLEERVKTRTAELETEMLVRKEMEKALGKSETNYRELVETANSIIIKMDQDGILTFVNNFAQKFFGYTQEELIGQNVKIIVPPSESTGRNLKAMVDTILRNPDKHIENINENITKNGERVWISWRNKGIKDSQGNIIGNLAIGQDITDLKLIEDALRESETRFRTMANSIPQLAWIARADGFITWYNQRWYDYTGTMPEQMEGWGWQSIHDPKVLPEVMERWKTAIATGEPFDMEFPLLGADKIFRPFLTRVQPLKNEQGRVIRWFGTNTDLSERKQAEEELALNEREFRLLAESMPQIVWTTRVDGWNTYFNQKWVDYTGLTLEESYGHGWNKPFHPDDQQRAWDAWQNAVLHNSPYLLQCRLRRADGIYRWWLIHGVPVLDENGNIIKWYGTCTDINDLKQAEEVMFQSQNQFNLLIKNIRSGMALIDSTGTFTIVNPSFLQMFGLKNDETIKNVNDKNWNDWQVFERDGTLLPIDEHPVRKAAITGKPVRDKLVGVKLPSGGDLIWMLISADLVRRPDGSIQSTICTYYDITERKRVEEALRQSEERYRALFNSLLEGYCIIEMVFDASGKPVDYRFLEINQAFEAQTGLHDAQGKLMRELAPEHEEHWFEIYGKVALTGEPAHFENEANALNRKYEVNAFRVGGEESRKVAICFTDVSERKNREKEQEKYNRTLKALSRSSQVMMRATEEHAFMEEVCKIIVEDCGYTMVWIGFAEDDEDKTVRPVAYSGFEEGYIDTLKITWADTERGRGPTGMAIRMGKPTTCRNMLTDPRFEPWRKEAIKRGYASSIVLPLMVGDKAIGALTIYSKEPDSFAGDEEKLLAELANDLSYGITAIRLREALRESEEHFHAIATNTPDHILMQDSDLRYQLVINPQLNLTESDMLGKTDYDILELRDADKLTAIKRKVLETGEAVSLESSLINSRGEPEYFEGTYVPKLGPAGKTEGIIGYFRNTTERKRIEEAIIRAKEEWERTFDTVPDLIAILDKEHRVVRINKAMAKRLRLKPDQCIGARCYEIVHGISCPLESCPHSRTCHDGGEHTAEVHEAILGGDFLVSTTPLYDSAGQLAGSVHVARDITGRKAAENQLEKQAAQLQKRKAQLEEINSELESFSYSVSHDLRAPLRAIDGFSRIILRQQGDKFDEKTRHQFNLIRDNVKLMGILIENILSFSRVQKTSMSISVIDMDKLAREVWNEIKAENKGRKIEFKIKKIKPGYGDHTLIRQVLLNLFSNAVKFAKNKKQGIIEMNSYVESGNAVYCIKDNGVGFDMAHYDKLFGVFQRLHSSEEYEGTGIGLAIVQRIVSRHGGRVWAEAEVKKGAKFYFTLNSPPIDDAPERHRKKRNS
jgi:PAS domain S-box-containing protein